MVQSVSVIIPVRNRPRVVHRAIDSILSQTYTVSEIIVVDDGSTDSTPDSVADRKLPVPLRLIRRNVSAGAPSARNQGAAAANGKLLAFLDSDDSWEAHKLTAQVELLTRYPESPAAFTNIQRIRDGVLAERTHVAEVVQAAHLYEANVLGGCSTAVIRSAAFHAVGGFRPNLVSCQDWDLWLRLSDLGALVCAEQPLTRYYFDASDRISANTSRVLEGHEVVMHDIYERIGDQGAKRLRRVHLRYLMETAYFSLKDEQVGRQFAKRVLREPANAGAFGRALKLLILRSQPALLLMPIVRRFVK